MIKAHELSTKQYDTLSSISDEKTVDSFLENINTKYGGGEILAYEHMHDIFSKKYYNEEGDWLTLYIDTIRMLELMGENKFIILDANNFDKIRKVHDAISKKIKIDEEIVSLYSKAVNVFSSLSQTISGTGFSARFELISTVEELNKEGSSMEHCIASYAHFIAAGNYVGLRVFEETTNGRFTLGLHRVSGKESLVFDQLKGVGNTPANIPACLAAVEFCNKNGIQVSVKDNYDLSPIK